jgi:hypothetical protein
MSQSSKKHLHLVRQACYILDVANKATSAIVRVRMLERERNKSQDKPNRDEGKIMKTMQPFALILIAQTCIAAVAHALSPNMIGTWKVDIPFTNGESRSLRIDAQGAGKGTFLLLDPKLNVWGPAKPSEAKWTQGEGTSVTFSGAVEFLLGNVGRDAGTLVCKGKFETSDLITGEVEFSRLVGDQPSKHGTFKAVRAGGG